MIVVSRRVGSLAIIRMSSPVTEGEIDAFLVDVRRVVSSIRGPVVFCSDIREAQVMSDPIADKVMASMRRENPRIVRAAILLPTQSAVLALQFERIIREAGNPARRSFRDAKQAVAWLSEVLNPAERKSLADYIRGSTKGSI